MTDDVSQFDISPLKEMAFSKVDIIKSTPCVFHVLTSPLNNSALSNNDAMIVTLETSHAERSQLNVLAPRNVLWRFSSEFVVQEEMSALNEDAPLNVFCSRTPKNVKDTCEDKSKIITPRMYAILTPISRTWLTSHMEIS